jgi:hypothetical protein
MICLKSCNNFCVLHEVVSCVKTRLPRTAVENASNFELYSSTILLLYPWYPLDTVGPRAGLDATEKRKISCPCQESEEPIEDDEHRGL